MGTDGDGAPHRSRFGWGEGGKKVWEEGRWESLSFSQSQRRRLGSAGGRLRNH